VKAHRPELADVFRTHQNDFLARWNAVLSREQRKALRDIRDCRTAALGGHLFLAPGVEDREEADRGA
jgi:hypothetical protein